MKSVSDEILLTEIKVNNNASSTKNAIYAWTWIRPAGWMLPGARVGATVQPAYRGHDDTVVWNW